MLLLRDPDIRKLFSTRYGATVNPATVWQSTDFQAAPIAGSEDQEFSLLVSFGVFWQGQIIKPLQQILTIAGESVEPNAE